MPEANYTKIEQLEAWAQERGQTLSKLAQAGLLSQPAVCSVISGATRLEQIQANIKAAEWQLGAEDVKAGWRILSSPFAQWFLFLIPIVRVGPPDR